MAYVTNNLNLVLTGPLESDTKEWFYVSTDSLATITAAAYISDAAKKGMLKGDLVWVFNKTPPSITACIVLSLTAGVGGTATLGVLALAGPAEVATALSTVGAGTITAAMLNGGVVTRGGAQTSTPFTDTTDTAALIIAGLSNPAVGRSYEVTYDNTTNAAATITGGTGVTVSGLTIVPANTWARFLVTYTAAATVTMVGIAAGPMASLPATAFTSISSGNGTLAAGNMEGAQDVILATSGATALTTRTAAQIIANVPNAQIGMSWLFRCFNTNGGTLTFTGGTGVTITGTATLATNVTRDYTVTITGAATVTMQNIGAGNAT